jgi:hypothetical protein
MNRAFLFLALVSTLFFVGCATEVSEIAEDPRAFENQEILITGNIGNTIVLTPPVVPRTGQPGYLTVTRLFDSNNRAIGVIFVSPKRYLGNEEITVRGKVMMLIGSGVSASARDIASDIESYLISEGYIPEDWSVPQSLVVAIQALRALTDELFFILEVE